MNRAIPKLVYSSRIFIFILITPFLKPLYFSELTTLNNIIGLWKMMAIMLIFIIWIMDSSIDKFTLCVVGYSIYIFTVTIVTDGEIVTSLQNAITLIALCLLFSMAAKYNSIKFLNIANLLLEILIYTNLIVIILYPDGIYNFAEVNEHYLLGHRNVMMRTIYPGICISILNSYVSKRKISIRSIMLIIASGLSLILVWSITAFVAYVVFILFLVLINKNKIPFWFSVKTAYSTFAVLFFVIIIFRFQNIFSFFIVDVLHKDLTFTGRTIIWSLAMVLILKNPLFGYGLEADSVIKAKLYKFTSAHNIVLDMLYQGGIIGISLFMAMLVFLMKKIEALKTDKVYKYFVLFVYGYCIMWNFEPFINGDLRFVIALFAFIYHYNTEILSPKYKRIKLIIR